MSNLPRAFGTDRAERGPAEEVLLICASPKAWRARQPKTLTTAEYPGTAVEWEGRLFEVVRAEPLADGGVRYGLAPWPEAHAIRRLERYDEGSEQARASEHGSRRDSVRRRRLSILLAPLFGLLPGDRQKRMESEFGAPALGMTISSAFPLLVVGFLGLFAHFAGTLGAERLFPVWLAPPVGIALYLFLESSLRLASAIAGGEPMGSLPVVLVFEITRPRRAQAPAPLRAAAPRDDRTLHDRFLVLEPVLSLLPPDDQRMIARRFPFDPIRQGKIMTAFLGAIAALNAGISLVGLIARVSPATDLLWLLPSGYLLFEQISRWRRLARGEPAGSVLAFIVRPLARPLLG